MPVLFLGFPADHADGVYRLFKWETKKAVLSRDVTWLGQTYSMFKGIKNKVIGEITKYNKQEK